MTEETKAMVQRNICFLLNQFIRCSTYKNVIFCWVMHEQSILDALLAGLDLSGCEVKVVSLLCSEATLRARLMRDVAAGIRTEDVVARSVVRLPLYTALHTQKIDTDHKTVETAAEAVIALPCGPI